MTLREDLEELRDDIIVMGDRETYYRETLVMVLDLAVEALNAPSDEPRWRSTMENIIVTTNGRHAFLRPS